MNYQPGNGSPNWKKLKNSTHRLAHTWRILKKKRTRKEEINRTLLQLKKEEEAKNKGICGAKLLLEQYEKYLQNNPNIPAFEKQLERKREYQTKTGGEKSSLAINHDKIQEVGDLEKWRAFWKALLP